MTDDEQAKALAKIAEQLEALPTRMAGAMGKGPTQPVSPFDPNFVLKALGIDTKEARERRKIAEEVKHLRQTRITAQVAVVFAGLSAIGTLAIAASQAF